MSAVLAELRACVRGSSIARAAVVPVRLAHTRHYTAPSQAELEEERDAFEEKVRDGERDVVRMGFPWQNIFRQNVVWGDHDQFQHVNNVHYIRWFESARMELLERMTRPLARSLRDDFALGRNTGVILASNYCRYRRPVMYPDTVLIGQAVEVPLKRDDRFMLKSVVYSVAQQAVVAEGEHDCVMYDYNAQRKSTFPPSFREALEAWGRRSPEGERK
ncbi:hypothetical protein MSPP1_000401 [Malassezia sp. CBS 17886]|nr:hypothetical protein MSPP1_000401 [Malassezia sp. CBS 17886]